MVFVYLLVAILGAAAMTFAVQNLDPVAVTFLGSRTVSLPLSLLLMLSVFVGIVFASVSGFAHYYGYGSDHVTRNTTPLVVDSGLRALRRGGNPYPGMS